MYFSVGFYMCSLSRVEGRPLAKPPTVFARGLLGKQGFPPTNRLWNLAGAASGAAGLTTDPGSCDPDLASKPRRLRQTSRARGYPFY